MELEVKDLSVRIKKKMILQEISFRCKPGIYAVIGENGAGKTTLFRAILGLQNGTGTCCFHGFDRYNIGYLPQHFETLNHISVQDAMVYFACLEELEDHVQEKEIERVLTMVNLWEERTKKVGKLSGGMYQRLGIAQAMLGENKLLILDEPTAGLDPIERLNFRRIIQQIEKESPEKIILISSHDTKELDEICKNVIFLHRGRLLICDKLESLYKDYNTSRLEEIFFCLTGVKRRA